MAYDWSDIAYQRAALDRCLPMAEGFVVAGTPWHSHVLVPGCVLNRFERYSIVLEDDSQGLVYMAPSDEFPMVDRDFVRMLHGDDIIDPGSTAAAAGAHVSARLLDELAAVSADGVSWHHHMHFPSCAFNPTPGEWAIVIEARGKLLQQSWEAEPVDVLREIEVLFFTTQEVVDEN